ncbi:MAG: cation:proton antiporter [Chloroflexi bacterium]|nr:cation:proton antiporter [Chloroflexota bacterium]MBK6713321.1 cation:proton antiporter [Chloroflexota bacterium]MBK7176941.1 cation:proton antiporter [Chloroflexota bacterium]MBK7918317.1 cation:proton antiporter [Chloroflexota bacterium]MBK8933002.1 cation:proton antiporter [Chloroflexota bacterium]
MLTTILTTTIYLSLLIHLALIAVAVWRVWRGENVIDRLIGLDVLSLLFLAMLVLLALVYRDSIYIDVALGLAGLGFITTIALAKYVADEQMF